MRRVAGLAIALLTAVAAGAAWAQIVVGPRPQAMDDRWIMAPPGVTVETWAEGFTGPWSLAFFADGRALVSERNGRLKLVERDGEVRKLGRLQISEGDESGLMGIAIHPNYPDPPLIYAMYTTRVGGGNVNAVASFTLRDDTVGNGRLIVNAIPGGRVHNGGRIAFGPDGMLYVGTGDVWRRDLAQRKASLAGKILRVAPDGAIPADNPFPDSAVWSLGHRNVQGLAWDPETGAMYATEHGPSGEADIYAFDEVNVIQRGANYGWPRAVGAPAYRDYSDPLVAWPDETTPPSGAAFWRGDLYVATLGSEALVRVRLDDGRVVGVERWFTDGERSAYGRLRDAVRGPDGALYVLTGGHDRRGDGRGASDRILRITGTPE